MKTVYPRLLLLFLFCSCLQEEPLPDVCVVDLSGEYAYKPKFKVIFPPETGEDLGPCTRVFPKDVQGYYQALSDEICPLEQNFLKVLELDPELSDPKGWQLDLSDLERSGIQYIGMLIADRRYVYINGFTFFTEEDLNNNYLGWRDRFVQPCDGGAWGVLFDLETETFCELAFEHR